MRVLAVALLMVMCLLAPPSIVWGIGAVWGQPYMVWTYRFHDNRDPFNPLAPRRYIDCTYVNWNGAVTVSAHDGRCRWVRFFKRSG